MYRKIFDGRDKETSEMKSLWVLEKEQLDGMRKSERHRIYECMKRNNLIKIKHPNILQVIHPVSDGKTTVAFDTEPVIGTLSNLLQHLKNVDNPSAFETNLTDIDVGLLDICQGIYFLHNNANMLHLNISPENIVVTKEGGWKLTGLDFATNEDDVTEYKWDEAIHKDISDRPHLDYTAPEKVFLNRETDKCDAFSLGLVIYEMFTKTKLLQTQNEFFAYKNSVQQIYPIPNLSVFPEDIREPLQGLLLPDADRRMSITEFIKSRYFDDIVVSTIYFLSHMIEKDGQEKVEFMQGLYTALPKLPLIVLGYLVKELINPVMVPYLLPTIFWIVERSDTSLFQNQVYRYLEPIFNMFSPYQIPLLLIENINLLLKHTTKEQSEKSILPMVLSCLTHEKKELQLAILNIAHDVAGLLSYDQLTQTLLPSLKDLCFTTKSVKLRVKTLESYSKIVDHLSKRAIQELVFPVVHKCCSVDNTPSVQLACVAVCVEIAKKVEDTFIAKVVLPMLMPILVNENIKMSQFTYISKAIRTMMDDIETVRRNTLEDNELKREQTKRVVAMEHSEKFEHFNEMVTSDFNKKKEETRQTNIQKSAQKQQDHQYESSFQQLVQNNTQKKVEPKPQKQKAQFNIGPLRNSSKLSDSGSFELSEPPSIEDRDSNDSFSNSSFGNFGGYERKPIQRETFGNSSSSEFYVSEDVKQASPIITTRKANNEPQDLNRYKGLLTGGAPKEEPKPAANNNNNDFDFYFNNSNTNTTYGNNNNNFSNTNFGFNNNTNNDFFSGTQNTSTQTSNSDVFDLL